MRTRPSPVKGSSLAFRADDRQYRTTHRLPSRPHLVCWHWEYRDSQFGGARRVRSLRPDPTNLCNCCNISISLIFPTGDLRSIALFFVSYLVNFSLIRVKLQPVSLFITDQHCWKRQIIAHISQNHNAGAHDHQEYSDWLVFFGRLNEAVGAGWIRKVQVLQASLE